MKIWDLRVLKLLNYIFELLKLILLIVRSLYRIITIIISTFKDPYTVCVGPLNHCIDYDANTACSNVLRYLMGLSTHNLKFTSYTWH